MHDIKLGMAVLPMEHSVQARLNVTVFWIWIKVIIISDFAHRMSIDKGIPYPAYLT